MADLPSGTVTFLFTNLEGSTRLLRELGRDRYGEVLREHEHLLRDAFEGAGGHVIDTQGDAFFVAFRSAADAVAAAVAAQRALTTHEWPDGLPVRIRMGIHTGEAAVTTDRYLGLAVHKAARICAAGHGGQVLLSNTARELVEDELPPDVGLRDLREQRLKDVERPERLTQLVIAGVPDSFPPPRTLEAAPFAGREGELAEAAQAAVAPPRRLRRPVMLVAAASVLAAAVAAAVLLLADGGAESAAGAPDSVVAIDPRTNKLVAGIPVGKKPSHVTVGEGAVWVLNSDDRTISRIDPETQAVRTFATEATPTGLAAGEGALWVANAFDDNVTRIDPDSTLAEGTISLPRSVGARPQRPHLAVAAGRGSVWVGGSARGSIIGASERGLLWRIDPRTNEIAEATRALGASAIAVAERAVWVAESSFGIVSRLDTDTAAVRAAIDVPGAGDLAVGHDAVWVVGDSGLVWQIDPQADRPVKTISVGGIGSGIAVGFGSVWVANGEAVVRIDPATGGVETIDVAGTSVDVAVGEERVWVAIG